MSKDLFKNVGTKSADETKPDEAPATPVVNEKQDAPATPEPVEETRDPLDHDGDGKKGGAAPAQGEVVEDNPQPPVVDVINPAEESVQKLDPNPSLDTPIPPVETVMQEGAAELADEDEDDEDPNAPKVDELAFLKQRADLMGIKYSNNIGVDALREKIKAKTEAETTTSDDDDVVEDEPVVEEDPDYEGEANASAPISKEHSNVTGLDPNEAATYTKPRKSKKMSARAYVMREKMKLVRLRITNLDPKKKDIPGEYITVANEYIGTVKKYVPFGEASENGYHVPYCIYEFLRDRRFLNIRTRKGKFNTPIVEQGWAKEFALEVLPPLTAEELAKLSTVQQAAGYGLED